MSANLNSFLGGSNITAFSVLTAPENGTVDLDNSGVFTYSPADNFSGQDGFTYRFTRRNGNTGTGRVTIIVTPTADAPTARNSSFSGDEDSSISGQVDATDSDSTTLAYSITAQPSYGSVILRQNGSFTYTPNPDFFGADAFEFTASDENASSAPATVNITVNAVNDAPVAIAQMQSISENSTVDAQLGATDIEGDTLSYRLDSPAADGEASIQSNGAYTYQPNPEFFGTDSFVFAVSDGNGGVDTATVTVTITGVNDAPVANDTSITIDEDSGQVTDTVTGSDIDDDDASLNYALEDAAADGVATVAPNGRITYTPDANFNGTDVFTFSVRDDEGASDIGTVTVTVNSINDAPTIAAQTLTTDEDTAVAGQASASDNDHATSELRYRLSQPASHGAASVSEIGELNYVPNTDFNGADAFVVEVFDPENGSDTAVVDITINPVNDAPNGANDSLENLVTEDSLFTGQFTVSDVDGDPITYQLSTADGEVAQFGVASVSEESGDYSYQPAPNYNGGNGDGRDYQDDVFRVIVFDNGIEAGRITVNIEVTPVNDPPVAVEGFYGTQVDTTLTGRLPATDVDGDTLTFMLNDSVPEGGMLTVNEDGSFEYMPPDGQTLESSFSFTVSDGVETSPPADARIFVVDQIGQSTNVDLTSLAGPSPQQVGTPPPPGPPVTIHFTVHEPTDFSPNQKYPLVLEGHGYGGRRTNASERNNGGFKGLLNAGYGVISITQRGFGRTEGHTDTGNIRLFDPNYEGRDLMQVIDWAEENLDWLLYKDSSGAVVDRSDPDANLVLGAIGGSYGGGYQHTIAAIDPKRRIDALAAEITWYDLRYSLFSGNVFKSYWAGLLSAAGNGTGSQDPEVNQGLAQGLGANFLDADKLKLLYDHSFISHCEDNSIYTHNVTAVDGLGPDQDNLLQPVDALYWQSPADSLFNMNEMRRNAACLRARGADVRALTKVNGHDGGTGSNCGPFTVNQTVRDWFDEKLKGISGQADNIPENCFNLRVSTATANDHIITDVFPLGGTSFEVDSNGQDAGGDAIAITANGNDFRTIVDVPLLTTTEETIIAGVPTAQLTLDGPLAPPAGTPDPGLLPSDPILFIGLAIGDNLQMANQVRPIRQYGTHDIELIGLNVKIPADTTVSFRIYAAFSGRYPGSGTNQPTPVTLQGAVQLPLHSAD